MESFTITKDSVRVLDSSFILKHVPMVDAIGLMKSAFQLLSSKEAHIPARIVMTTQDETMSVFFKPAFMSRFNRMSIKILTQILANNSDIPTIKGMVLLLDMQSGQILSISDGTSITALRTGAASGIASQYLSNHDSSSLAVFGCGAQGRTQVEAILAVRPIQQIVLFDRMASKANALSTEIREYTGLICTVNPDMGILKEMDIICTATPGNQPLFKLKDIKPGVHINAIGSYRPDMQEIDPDVFGAGLIYLDDAPACLKESGDLVNPLATGVIIPEDIKGEIGELISGTIEGRKNSSDITVFKSVGNAIQDFFIANEAYEKSISQLGAQIVNF